MNRQRCFVCEELIGLQGDGCLACEIQNESSFDGYMHHATNLPRHIFAQATQMSYLTVNSPSLAPVNELRASSSAVYVPFSETFEYSSSPAMRSLLPSNNATNVFSEQPAVSSPFGFESQNNSFLRLNSLELPYAEPWPTDLSDIRPITRENTAPDPILQRNSHDFILDIRACCREPEQIMQPHSSTEQMYPFETTETSDAILFSVLHQDSPHLIANLFRSDFEPENNVEAFVRSSNLHEAISRLSQQTSLFKVLNHPTPATLLDKYLQSYTLIADTMLFPTQESFSSENLSTRSLHRLLPYSKWNAVLQTRLASFFTALVEIWRELIQTKSAKYLTLEKAFPINPDKPTFSWSEARDIYLSYVAHSLLVEIAELVPWRLHWYSKESLLHLFSAENTIININHFPSSSDYHSIAEMRQTGKFYVGRKFQNIGYFPQILYYEAVPINPIQIFLFLEERNLINRFGFPTHPIETGSNKIITNFAELGFGPNTVSGFGLARDMNNKGFSLYDWYDDQSTPNSREIKRTLSVICRWFMYHVRHTFAYAYYFRQSSFHPQPPMDRCLSLPIPEKRRVPPHSVNLNYLFSQFPNLPLSSKKILLKNPTILFDKNGTVVDGASLESNKKLQLQWARFPAFSGCHGASGMLYWMLRSLNIPSEIITTYANYRGNVNNPNPNDGHRGITVFVPGKTLIDPDEGLYLFHLDEIYAVPRSFDPLIDPINHFVDKKTFNRWFSPPLRPSTASDELLFFSDLLNMRYVFGYYPSYASSRSIESLLKTNYDPYDGKIWLTQTLSGQKEFAELRNQLYQILSFRKQQIEQGKNLPLGFDKGSQYELDWYKFIDDRYLYITNKVGSFTEDPIKETKWI